jgi:hypothetical protein
MKIGLINIDHEVVAVFFSVRLCVLVSSHRFVGTYGIHFHGPRINYSSLLKMEIEDLPETLVRRHQNTWRLIKIQQFSSHVKGQGTKAKS